MKKNVKFLPSSLSAVEHLRYDVDSMTMKFYTLPEAPKGIFHPDYEEKCYTFAAGVSGNASVDYVVLMALRPDFASQGEGKVLDIDTAAFCFKADDVQSMPTGVALFHQKFEGRTTPLSGYEAFTLDMTVNDLHSKLIPQSIPLAESDPTLINAMAHSIGKYQTLLAPQIQQWNEELEDHTSSPPVD